MEEIDLKEIVHMFWSKKVPIFIIVLIFLIIGCVYTLKFTEPIYSSSVTLILANPNETITTADLSVNAKLMATYSALITSERVLGEVATNLNVKEEELKNNVTVSIIQNSELIKITVKDEIPEKATRITNEIARVFSQKVRELYNINNIQVMSEADVPKEPSNINHQKDVLMFAFGGMVVAGIYVIIANMLDNTIKTAENIENEFNLPVLASIPDYEGDKGGKK